MAQKITVNQSKGSRGVSTLVVRANTTGFISFTGNAPENYAANTAGETVSSLHIAEIYWNTNNAAFYWTIRRGNTTVFRCYGQNGYANFADKGMRLETPTEAQANVVFIQTGNVDLVMKLHKSGGA